jgi:hypothetical protein
MFICKECLEKRFKNNGIIISYGVCESCGETRECFDIPSSFLQLKD